MTDVVIPELGESITSGIIAAWHVADGDVVEKGQVLFELETDKITSEGTAEVSGKVALKADEGDEVEIGAIIATIDESVSVESKPAEKAEEKAEEAPKEEAAAPATGKGSDAVSPAVRRIADETGIDPKTVTGTGKSGRVTKADMMAAKSPANLKSPARSEEPAISQPSANRGERTSRTKMSPLRKRIAERLVQAQSEAAMLTTFNEVDMSAVMGARKKYQDQFVEKHGIKLGFMSFFVKAVVNALQEVPAINAQIDGDYIVQNHFYDVGVAVGTPKGLLVPVVRDCDQKSFAEIEQDIVHYAKKARDGKIQIPDLEGGCVTITNGGIYGSMLSTPIINPPQSAILGMHNIVQRPIAVNGEVVIRPVMYLAVSYDHRIVDGQEAVTFLVKIKNAIEDPERLLYSV